MDEAEHPIQWHPAYCKSIRLELKDDKQDCIFDEEEPVGQLPMKVDMIITRKHPEKPMKSFLGKFRSSVPSVDRVIVTVH